MAPTKMEDPLA
jgi:hypothetical protein